MYRIERILHAREQGFNKQRRSNLHTSGTDTTQLVQFETKWKLSQHLSKTSDNLVIEFIFIS